MARPGLAIGLRPALVLAVVALIAAAVGVAVIGSRPQETSPSPSPRPSAEGSLPASPARFRTDLQMLLAGGDPLVVTVADTTGDLRAADSLQPPEGAAVDTGLVRIDPDPNDPATFTVLWTGLPCEHAAELIVNEEAHRIEITTEACEGDATGSNRLIRLTFAGPIDPELWSGSVSTIAPSGDPTAPTDQPSAPPPAGAIRVTLGARGPGEVIADVLDRSGHLDDVSVVDADRDEAVQFLTATNVDATTLSVVWPGMACDTVHRVTIAADFGLTIQRPECDGDTTPVTRALRLAFDQPVDSDVLDLGLPTGRPSADFPAFVVDGTDAAGELWQLAIIDESGTILDPAWLAAAGAIDPGAEGARLDQAGDAIVRLTWRDSPCDAAPTLRIDRTGTRWTLASASCSAIGPDVLRVLDIKLRNPLSVDAITITLETRPTA